MRVDADTLAQGPGDFSFSYADSNSPGTHIQERLRVDVQLGIIEWRRSAFQKDEEEEELGHGGAWATSAVCSVRYTTKWGDPSREFLLATQPHLVWRKDLLARLSLFATTLARIRSFILNPLALTLILSCALTAELWQAFPTTADGAYNMSEPANESALVWSTVFSVLGLFMAVLALWWLGVFRFACFKGDRALRGSFSRPSVVTTSRWENQTTGNAALLIAFVTCCLLSLVLCPVALALNTQEECQPYASPNASVAASAVSPIAGALDPCYSIDGMPLVCGVGPCSCSAVRELSCLEPPSPPAMACRRVPRPLCGSSDGNGAADPNGMHGFLVVNAITSAVMSCALGLCWIGNMGSLFLTTRQTFVKAEVPIAEYHRFDVTFRCGQQEPLMVILDGREDPLAVFSSLWPLREHGGVPPVGAAWPTPSAALGHSLRRTASGGSSVGIPTIMDGRPSRNASERHRLHSVGAASSEGGDTEPQWC